MSAYPCINPNCRSYKQPHPNCRCWEGMASGGEATPFCSQSRLHDSSCQYFPDGGEVVDFDSMQDDSVAQQPQQQDSQPQQFDSMVSDNAQFDDLQDDSQSQQQKYATPEQDARSWAESVARGTTFGLSDYVATKLGVPAEDIKGRQEAYPGNQVGQVMGNLFTTAMAPEVKVLTGLGGAALKSAIALGLYQTGDEISNAVLSGNPEPAVASYLAAGKRILSMAGAGALIGPFSHALGAGASKGLQALEDAGLPEKAQKFTMGMGMAQSGLTPEAELDPIVQKGYDFFNKGLTKVARQTTKAAGAAIGYLSGGASDILPGEVVGWLLSRPVSNAVKKYVAPALIRSLGEGGEGAAKAVQYGMDIAKGVRAMGTGVDALFKAGGRKALDDIDVSDKDRDTLKDYVEQGDNNVQQTPQGFAEGGPVEAGSEPDYFTSTFPEHNILLSTAKTRIPGYLNSIRPLPQQKLLFDKTLSDKAKEKSYKKALDLAIEPLGILNQIKDGSITPDSVKHFNSMHPEIHQELSKRITHKVTEMASEGERPSYRLRQGLSLFLGAPLDSTFTPQSIMAAQNVFALKSQQQLQPAPQKNKKGTSSLTKASKQYETSSQASETRARQ
jgi:hypothetical protein